jgi:hypothetical protein
MTLCLTCRHRADSKRRVAAARARGYLGLVADPTPRDECKRHAEYGEPEKSREECGDYRTDAGKED